MTSRVKPWYMTNLGEIFEHISDHVGSFSELFPRLEVHGKFISLRF